MCVYVLITVIVEQHYVVINDVGVIYVFALSLCCKTTSVCVT